MDDKKCQVKGILLDLDGTIVDSRRAYLNAAETAFSTLGVEIHDIRVVTEIPRRMEQKLPVNDLLEGIDVEKFLKVYLDAYYRATAEKSRPMPNISDTLRKLSRAAKLAVVTMRHVSKQKIAEELENYGLAEYFVDIVTALDTPSPKPSPDALMISCQKIGVEPEDCLVVGDSVADIRAGKKARIRTVALSSGLFSAEELKRENPDILLDNIGSLPDFLEACGRKIAPR